ncbi:prepilin-type N-terminal cleavage/methylation domain-containing protein [Candidatus Avelusimicrobium alvi]|uniref:prepilin-type N-terminal cleavage/methylation domain-containing protein n=1 Tax=Candidatus Avelusimicrobium alvi TaxID=3416221 RepID=UPI003D0B5FAB
MQTSHKRKKAFTLTELLVVVIVIGVLSAVVLPKFSKVVETRKTTEAEELMSAVRTEQEKRCVLDKNYLTDFKAIEDIAASKNSKNYAYSLTSTGMEAQSKGKYGYTLKMPSYADGRICCENEAECAKLNKDYPLCSALIARADYQSGAECAGESEEKQCTGSSTRSCGCNNGGTQTRTCDTSTGTWSGWSACSISDACSCEGESTRACGCQGKGTQTRTCNTSNGTWGEWGACSVADECECTGTKPEESQACNNCGTQTRSVTCNASTGEWSTGAWSECSKTEAECTTCPEGKVLENGVCVCENNWFKDLCTGEVTCDDESTSTQTWNEETCECEDSCPTPSDTPHYLRCRGHLTGRYGNLDPKMDGAISTHSSMEAARIACETYGQDVTFYQWHAPVVQNCSDPNKPCNPTGVGWYGIWECSEDKSCGGGLGRLDRCTCYYGVG